MRKVFSFFALTLLLLSVSSCIDDNNADSIVRRFSGEFINNSVDLSTNTSAGVSSSQAEVEWKVSENTISVTYTVAYDGHNTATLKLTDVPLTPNNTLACYTFETANGGNGITAVKGYYSADNKRGSFLIEFTVNGTHRVISSAQLLFPYTNCAVSDIEDPGQPAIENDKAYFEIIMNPTNMKAYISIKNFALTQKSGLIQRVTFTDLNVEATSDGYKVTSNEEIKSDDENYTLTDFEAIVSQNCHVVNSTFKIDGKYACTLHGTAFAE